MPVWRVQYVDPYEVHCLSVYRDEGIARVDTGRHLAALVGTLLAKLPFRHRGYGRDFPEMVAEAEPLAEQIASLLAEGREWEAYDAWHGFLARWRHVFGLPWFQGVGTVVVQGPGPLVQLPLFPFKGPPAPGGASLRGPAEPEKRRRRRYKVWWEDEQGRSHASIHLDEKAAEAEVAQALQAILQSAEFTMEVFRGFIWERHRDYFIDARDAIAETRRMLEAGNVFAAYDRWREFEEEDEEVGKENGGEVGPPPLSPRIGRIRMEID